ncbi:MAG: patatin-like phospholipase family protein [Clostridia bacterium]|nr:patatin-like phospholipase family protein [Clostridia bacterium]MDD4376008.1 patatin-like phospholipase family protein [Clostridia bacterium]
MYGIALEGGGAKGAYHIGALKALLENGYKVGAIVGTSIGAFNAAVVAQGDFDKLYEMWSNSTSMDLFDISKEDLEKLISRKVDTDLIKNLAGYVKNITLNKGIDTTKYREFINAYVNEEKLRNSNIEYGLVTVSLTDRTPLELYKEDIPEGKVTSYIMASSYLPVFKSEKIDEKIFIDGGFYNNCPVNMLLSKGYKNIIEIRTKGIGIIKKVKYPKNVKAMIISPSNDLGSILFVDKEQINNNIKMGYYDALKQIKGLIGEVYYIIDPIDLRGFEILSDLKDKQIEKIASKHIKDFKNKEARKVLFEEIIPSIYKKLKIKKHSTYDEFLIGVMEILLAENETVEKYKLYTVSELLKILKKKVPSMLKKEKNSIIKNIHKEMALKLIKEIEL